MATETNKRHLNASIRWYCKGMFKIYLDGDVFWADTYQHAVLTLIHLLMRDEISYSSRKPKNEITHFDKLPFEL